MINNQAHFNWVLWTHSIGAYALIVMFYWKGTVIFDAIRRKNVWTRQRILFLLTLALLLLTLSLGLIWTFMGPHYFLRISLVSWHIYVSIPLMILMVWHAWKMRFIFRLPASKNRALFIKTAVFAIAGTVSWQLSNQAKSAFAFPGAKRRFTGSYAQGLEDGRFPIVSWIADNPPSVDLQKWQLSIQGAVSTPKRYCYDELQTMAQTSIQATLDCTGGWYTSQTWRGISLTHLLKEAAVLETAVSITVRSVTGYKRRFTLKEAKTYLLALDVRDAPLSHGHGFPLRLIAFDKRGVEWVKWVSHIHVNTTSKIWQSPLPLQ